MLLHRCHDLLNRESLTLHLTPSFLSWEFVRNHFLSGSVFGETLTGYRGKPCKDAMYRLSSWISSDSKDNQREDRPKRGRIRGTSAAEPKPQPTESTICDFAAVVGRATNSLRYVFLPLSGKAESRKNRFMMVIYKESKITPTFPLGHDAEPRQVHGRPSRAGPSVSPPFTA